MGAAMNTVKSERSVRKNETCLSNYKTKRRKSKAKIFDSPGTGNVEKKLY
jgi:hypothetical protein